MADIAASLQAVEQDKVNFGMEDVDFSSLMLGNEILAYEYTVDGLSQLDFSFIPVMSGSEIVALVLKDGFGASAITRQVGTALVPELNSVVSDNDEIAIIYDANGCHVYNHSTLITLHLSHQAPDSRIPFSADVAKSLQNNIITRPCAPQISIHLNHSIRQANRSAHIINMTFVSQQPDVYNELCWAACMSMMIKYYKNELISIVEIAQTVHGQNHFDHGADYEKIIPAYIDDFELQVKLVDESTPLTFEWVKDCIYADDPLHASFENIDLGNRKFHAAIIYGVISDGENVMIRDPDEGSFYGYYNENLEKVVYHTFYDGYEMHLYWAIYSEDEPENH